MLIMLCNVKTRYNTKDEERVRRGVAILKEHKVKMMGYAIGGYPDGDEFDDIFYRCEKLIEWGVDPYIMPYATANHDIRRLKRLITLRTYRKIGLREAWRRYQRRGDGFLSKEQQKHKDVKER